MVTEPISANYVKWDFVLKIVGTSIMIGLSVIGFFMLRTLESMEKNISNNAADTRKAAIAIEKHLEVYAHPGALRELDRHDHRIRELELDAGAK